MPATDKIKEGLKALVREAQPFVADKVEKDGTSILIQYQSWYTRALLVVKQMAPDRFDDFASQYQQSKRKALSISTYTICDYLHGLIVVDGDNKPKFDAHSVYFTRIGHQIGILRSVLDASDSILQDIYTTLQLDILDKDLVAAKALLKAKHLRSSGVVCGVILESHLKSVADRRGVTIKKKDPSISELNDLLKESGVYDVSLWRLTQRLGDIRNLCCHSKDREPKPDEVEDLIAGTDKILKEVI